MIAIDWYTLAQAIAIALAVVLVVIIISAGFWAAIEYEKEWLAVIVTAILIFCLLVFAIYRGILQQ